MASSPRSPVRMRITPTDETEDLLNADASGAGGVDDRLHRAFDHGVVADHFDLHLGEEVHHVFGAPVQLGMALLPPEPLGLDDRDALQAHLVQRFFHLIQFERLDDGLDFLHARQRPGEWAPVPRLPGTWR
jgi:hypothetical protein